MGSSTSNTTCHLKDIQIHKYYNGSDPVTTDPGPTTTNPDLTTTDLKTYPHMYDPEVFVSLNKIPGLEGHSIPGKTRL